jgi:hypothetical protein
LKLINKNKLYVFVSVAVLVPVLFYGCKGNEIYPIVPSITLKDVEVLYKPDNTDSLLTLVISYKDGDGDIGLDPGDTFPPYNSNSLGPPPNYPNTNRFYNNVWIDYYQKINGAYSRPMVPFTTDTIAFDVRVTNLTPEGSHKAIRGDISVLFAALDQGYIGRSDTIKLKVRLVDRALHVSNEIETPDLYLKR